MKKFIVILIIFIFLLIYFVCFNLNKYAKFQNKINNKVEYILENLDTYNFEENYDEDYIALYQYIIPKILVKKITVDNKKLSFVKLIPSYIVPEIIMEKADVMFGYGIYDDISAEEYWTKNYKKQVYAFDCGNKIYLSYNPLAYFEDSCIGTDKYVIPQLESSKKVHTFGSKIKELGLEDKQIFIKMDIAGAESEVLPEILEYKDNITGMTVCFHIETIQQLLQVIKVIDLIKQDFDIASRSDQVCCLRYIDENCKKVKYIKGSVSRLFVLSFVNKNLVQKSKISWNQKSAKADYLTFEGFDYKYSPTKIDYIVVLYEKLKMFKKKFCKKT